MAKSKTKDQKNTTDPKALQEDGKKVMDGVIVSLQDNQINVQHSGSVKPMEIPTLLRRAAKFAENQLGLD